jgi:hypothetical protein
MKNLSLLPFVLLFSATIIAQNQTKMTPEQVVQENLDFYNNRDIEGFMTSFSDEIKMYNLADPNPTVVGRAEVRKVYTNLFEKSPDLHSTILKRMVIGNKVIDHESITGRNGNADVLELVLIYEVKNQKIYRITVIRK